MSTGSKPWNPGPARQIEFPLNRGADFAGYSTAAAAPDPWVVLLATVAGCVVCAAVVGTCLLMFLFMASFARGMGP